MKNGNLKINTFKRKEILIEGSSATVHFDYKYVIQKRKDVLDCALERAGYSFRCFIIEVERHVGYLSIIKDGEIPFFKELARKEITFEKLNNLFEL